jgi:hypothetical protein
MLSDSYARSARSVLRRSFQLSETHTLVTSDIARSKRIGGMLNYYYYYYYYREAT